MTLGSIGGHLVSSAGPLEVMSGSISGRFRPHRGRCLIDLGPHGVDLTGHRKAEKELEADIGEFAADPARESWALPRLSTGRRREARRVVERFPGLRCESFGFGEDHTSRGVGNVRATCIHVYVYTRSNGRPPNTNGCAPYMGPGTGARAVSTAQDGYVGGCPPACDDSRGRRLPWHAAAGGGHPSGRDPGGRFHETDEGIVRRAA